MTTAHLPDLMQTLQGHDLGYLQIIAKAWDLEFSAPDAQMGIKQLASMLLDRDLLNNMLRAISQDARTAFYDLVDNDGKLPWALFTRRHGTLREMGPARRDRERPYLEPISAVERLWYRSLIGRSFLNTPAGPIEYAYIPEDFLELVTASGNPQTLFLGRVATPKEREVQILADDRILDDACTLLAAGRASHRPIEGIFLCQRGLSEVPENYIRFLTNLLSGADLLDLAGVPKPETTRVFLERGRGEALVGLVQVWLKSLNINELHLTPGLAVEGEWQNDILYARRKILDFIFQAPGQLNAFSEENLQDCRFADPKRERSYVNVNSFIKSIKEQQPDFQRPAGDYDSWFVRDPISGLFLRGFEHWDQVDGAFLWFMISGPLHWLGLVDLATNAKESSQVSAFRLSSAAGCLLHGKTSLETLEGDDRWLVRSDGRIMAARLSSRKARYQLARFCRWEAFEDDAYVYRLTPKSLEGARKQGLRTSHLLNILRNQSAGVPRSLAQALVRWEKQAREAYFDRVVILRVKSPEILQALRSSRAAKYLGDPLGPTAIIVHSGAVELVMNVLAEMGILSEVDFED